MSQREQDREALRGMVAAGRSLCAGLGALFSGGRSPARPYDVALANPIAGAVDDLARAYTILLGGNPENEGDLDRIARWDAMTRTEQVYSHENGAAHHLDRVFGVFRTLYHASPDPKVLSWMSQAASDLAPVNGFSGKRFELEPVEPGMVRVVIAPHGDYSLAMKQAYTSIHYLVEWLRDGVGFPPDKIAGFGNVVGKTMQVMGLWGGIYDKPKELFCAVLEGRRIGWKSVTEDYQELVGTKLGHAWHNLDKALGSTDIFPNPPASERCK